MTQAQLINDIRNQTAVFLDLVEQAQSHAAIAVQEFAAMGPNALTGFDWESVDVTEAQINNALYSLQLMSSVLGGNAANLYPIK